MKKLSKKQEEFVNYVYDKFGIDDSEVICQLFDKMERGGFWEQVKPKLIGLLNPKPEIEVEIKPQGLTGTYTREDLEGIIMSFEGIINELKEKSNKIKIKNKGEK